MEILGIILVPISFSITIVIGGIALFRGMYFVLKALANTNKEVTRANYFTSFNFTNAIWIPNGLTSKGRIYRTKALKNFGIFIILVAVNAVLSELINMHAHST